MKRWILDWLLKSIKHDDRKTFEDYFSIGAKLSVIVALIIILAGWLTIIDLPYTIDGGALSSYVGTLLGTVVALAGSIVAISLAIQALNHSKEQISLSKTQISLSETQNRHSITQRPEYEKGLDAAMAYAKFKGILLLLPFELRALQKNNQLDLKKLASGAAEHVSLTGLSKHLDELLDTTFITVFDRVAWKSEGGSAGDELQYLFLNRFSSLQSTKNLLRGVKLGLTMQAEVDEIIRQVHQTPFSNVSGAKKQLSNFEDYGSYDNYIKEKELALDNLIFTEIEFWFIKHVYAYARTKSTVTYEDFKFLKTSAESTLRTIANNKGKGVTLLYKTCVDVKFYFNTTNKSVKLITSSEDSSLYKIMLLNRKHFESQGIPFESLTMQIPSYKQLKKEGVLQLVYPNNWDINLINLLNTLKHLGDDCKSKIIIIFDQVSLFEDSYSGGQHFGLRQHLLIWKFFSELSSLINKKEIVIQELLKDPHLLTSLDEVTEIKNSSIYFERMAERAKSLPNISAELINQDFTHLLEQAIEKIFVDNNIENLNAEDLMYQLKVMRPEHLDLNFTDQEIELIKHMALSPMLDRPMYGLKFPVGGFYESVANVIPSNVEILAYVNLDYQEADQPTLADNLFFEWILVRPTLDGTPSDREIYWID